MREVHHDRVELSGPKSVAPTMVARERTSPRLSGELTPTGVLALQRAAGNAAVTGLVEQGVAARSLQRKLYFDAQSVGANVKAPLSELFTAFMKAAKAGGEDKQMAQELRAAAREVAEMLQELGASSDSHIRLGIAPGESEGDYGGGTMLHFKVGDAWRSILRMTPADWSSLPRNAPAMFTLTLRHTAKHPIAGETDMHHWYTLIHEVGAHMVPLWKLVTQTRSGAVQYRPPTAEAIRSGEYGEATHHHQIAHGESPSFKALYEASQRYIWDHVDGAGLKGLWESHEDDESRQLVSPLTDRYASVMDPVEAEVKRLGQFAAAQDADQVEAARKRLRTTLPGAVDELRTILARLESISTRKRRKPPPKWPSRERDDEPPARPAPPIPPHLLPPLPAIVLTANNPWGWRDEKVRELATTIEKVQGAVDLLEDYVAQLGGEPALQT